MTREEFNYETYSKLVKTIWSEEFERLQEYVYSKYVDVLRVDDINTGNDVRGDKHWVETPDQDIPNFEEMFKVVTLCNSKYLGDLLHDELDSDSVEDMELQLKQIWYNEVS